MTAGLQIHIAAMVVSVSVTSFFVAALAGTTAAAPGDEGDGPRVRADVPATSNDLRAQRAQNSPLLSADPTNTRFVVLANRLDAPDFACALQLSGDGGRTWVPADPVPELPTGADKCYAPEVGFDTSGRLYYLFVGLQGAGNVPMGAFLTTSTDRARTFTPPRKVLGPNVFSVRMAIDPTLEGDGRLHLVWLQANSDPPLGGFPDPPNPIMSKYSADGGTTFSTPQQVSDPVREFVVAPSLTLGPNHAVHVLYYDLREDVRDYKGLEGPAWESPWSLVLSTSFDGGDRFEPSVVVDDQVMPPGRVMLIFTMAPASIITDEAGRVFAAWHDARNGDWDVFLRRSPDLGRSWEPAVRLNDDRVGNGAHQYLPRLAIAPGGRLDAIFYDRRRDSDNVRNDVFYTFSHDGGIHFSTNLRLNTRSSSSVSGQGYAIPSATGQADFGSRLALLSRDSGALAGWTDTRNALVSPYQDIFVSEVVFPTAAASEDTGTWLWPAAGAMAVIAMIGSLLATSHNRSTRRRKPPLGQEATCIDPVIGGVTGEDST